MKSSNARDPKNTPVFDVVTLLDLGGSLIFTNSRFPSSPNSSGLLGQANLAVDHPLEFGEEGKELWWPILD